MGRPTEIMNEDVIRAGNAILAENRTVNGTRLWRGVGEHGRPERLLAVWTKHAEASTTILHEPSSPVSALPEAASRLLSDCKVQLGAGLDGCVREIYAAVERTLIARFQSEMAAMTTSRELHQAELREAWQALGDLAERHDAALLQVKDGERDVLIAHATLKAERDILSRVKLDKGALSARIDGLTATLTAASDLARAAETGRTRAETLAGTMQAELRATRAELDGVRGANLDLERDVSAGRRAYQLQETQLQRQAEGFRDLHAELAAARDKQLEQANRVTGAEHALQALERIMARNARDKTANPSPRRGNRRATPASQSNAAEPLDGPRAVHEDLTPELAAGVIRHGRSLPQPPLQTPSTLQQGPIS